MLARQSLKPKLSTADYAGFEYRLVSLGRAVEISRGALHAPAGLKRQTCAKTALKSML
jgi:hypothetical protein